MKDLLKDDQFFQYINKVLYPGLSEEQALEAVTSSYKNWLLALEQWKTSQIAKH